MIRETKFRALNEKTNFWFEQHELVYHDSKFYQDWRNFEDGIALNMSDCTVMQYTGIKDKKGNEIYEGDILLVFENLEGSTYEFIGPVIWEGLGWVIIEKNDLEAPLFIYDNKESWIGRDMEIEVIGNIYDNPELIKSSY